MTCPTLLDVPELAGVAVTAVGIVVALAAVIVLSRIDRHYYIKRLHYMRIDTEQEVTA